MLGIVKWYNDGKGYGFIHANGDSKNVDIFAHYTAIEGDGFKTLIEGETVDFDMVDGPKGPQATVIRKVTV